MFKTIDEIIEEFFKDWKKLPPEKLDKNTRRLWILIGNFNAFFRNHKEAWNEVYQAYINNTKIFIPIYTFQYVNSELVLISPTGHTKILSGDERKLFEEEVDYMVEYKTEEKSAAEVIADLILTKYRF